VKAAPCAPNSDQSFVAQAGRSAISGGTWGEFRKSRTTVGIRIRSSILILRDLLSLNDSVRADGGLRSPRAPLPYPHASALIATALRSESKGGPGQCRSRLPFLRCSTTALGQRSLGYKPPAPEVFIPALAARAAAQPQPAPPPALAQRPTMH